MAATDVIWYSSDETGAPTMNNAAGAFVGVLDACLVNGFNAKSVTSIVVAAGIATATISAHGYSVGKGKHVLIAGATPAGLNGNKQVLSAPNSNTITFDATGIADQTATGTITAKRAPLGWTIPYTGTNKRVYARPTGVGATAMVLRVDDTSNSATARVRYHGAEAATTIDTHTGRFPLNAQISPSSQGLYMYRGNPTTDPKGWHLIGDGYRFFLIVHTYSYAEYGSAWTMPKQTMFFGDIKPVSPADAYHCMVSGAYYDFGATGEIQNFLAHVPLSTNGAISETSGQQFFPRAPSQTGTSRVGGAVYLTAESAYLSGGAPYQPSPHPVIGGVILLDYPIPIVANQSASTRPIVRGFMPGLVTSLQNDLVVVGNYELINTVPGSSKEYVMIRSGSQTTVAFDLTGPW